MTDAIEQYRTINHGFDPDRGSWVHRGLDLSRPTEITDEEIAAFKHHYATQFGHSLDGLNWWIEQNRRC